MSALRIALAQVNATVGDFDGNANRIADAADRAREAGAAVAVFPELALSGYPPEDLLLRPSFLADARAALDALAPKCKQLIAVVGFPEAADGAVYNAAAVIKDGRVASVYRKMELPNYGVFDEKRYFAAGVEPLLFEAGNMCIAVTICEDVWIEDGAAERALAGKGAGIVVNLSASPFHAGKSSTRREVLAHFARAVRAPVAYCNLVGGQDELVFDGGSVVVDAGGEVRASAPQFEEALLLVEFGEGAITGPRAADFDEIEAVYAALTLGTRDYARKNRFEHVTLGLSGGIDSALVACVAADALGPENVTAVTMPSPYTSAETLADVKKLAKNLGVALLEIPIDDVFRASMDALAPAFGEGDAGLAAENLQARVRGNFLMALSNRFGWLVLAAGNKSEVSVGYCTLYGDTAGGFAPIKDVLKSRVYELAALVNRRAGRAVIPESVLARAPTAELAPDQKDEDALPPYAVLDAILYEYIERDAPPEAIIARGFDEAIVREVVRLVDCSEYKRRQAAPGVRITPKAFGRDRRLPITNRYGGRDGGSGGRQGRDG